MKSRFVMPLVLLLVVLFAACNRTKRYPMQGEVVAKDAATGEITVNAGDIPGFMEAMAMPYRVKDPAVVQQVEPGDKISAEVVVRNGRSDTEGSDYWLENVRITDQSGRGKIRLPPGSKMLPIGARVPEVTLVNQDGRKIHFSDFTGKAVLVTFIYTRCPMPDFCPRLSSEFARIQNELKKNPVDYKNTHLITISFDPKYDSASVLHRYGLGYLDGDKTGFSHWDFATANPADLHQLAEDFGLEYGGNNQQMKDKQIDAHQMNDKQITHTMVIVLIAPDGTVANYWSTNWTWTELMSSLQHAARSASQTGGI
jgi:protein SCO1/2